MVLALVNGLTLIVHLLIEISSIQNVVTLLEITALFSNQNIHICEHSTFSTVIFRQKSLHSIINFPFIVFDEQTD